MVKHYFLIFLFIIPIISFAQVVEEKIQIDTITETIQVIYRPQVSTTYYTKKIAVFANDTFQVAIEKAYNRIGQNGLYKVYYPNGRLKIKTVFANNSINGEWTYYDQNGIIITKGNYARGKKHGYWAYKSLKIYGKYKNGLKSWIWHRIDANKKKVKSTYKKGVLFRGKGFGDETISVSTVNSESKDTLDPKENKELLNKECEQAISFLKDNLVFKKALKVHFSKSKLKKVRELKKYFFRGQFQFVIAPLEMNLGINTFIQESENGKIVVAKIDSILKNNTELQTIFSKSKIAENNMLFKHSTKISSTMAVYFSKIRQNLLRIDVVRFKKEVIKSDFKNSYASSEKGQRFEVLLYFDDEGVLKGAEYGKPQ